MTSAQSELKRARQTIQELEILNLEKDRFYDNVPIEAQRMLEGVKLKQ